MFSPLEEPDWKAFAMEGAKIIDELLVLFRLEKQDYNIVDVALHHVANARNYNPRQPITASLVPLLKSKQLLTKETV